MNDQELTAALVAINGRNEQFQKEHKEELRGEKGDPGIGLPGKDGRDGKDGKDGRDGKDAPVPEIVVGNVYVSDKPSARFRRGENGVYVLDLTFKAGEPGRDGRDSDVPGPEGRPGRDSNIPGPEGRPGRDGKDSTVAGPAGESIVGPKGDKGDPAMTREEIVQVLVETLSNVGVMTEQAQKLMAVRAKLKAAIHDADERHQSQYGRFLREVDKIF